MDNQNLYKIAAANLEGIGPVKLAHLISKTGCLEKLFSLSDCEIKHLSGFTFNQIQNMNRKNALKIAEEEQLKNEKKGIKTLFFLDENYPRRLKQCIDAPIVLYYKGTIDFNPSKIISIVGTRNMSSYGQNILDQFIQEIKDEDMVVVSGLAYGVDIHTHHLCLKHNIKTMGVLGHGLDRIYPAQHKKVANQMLEEGCLLSEFKMDTKPDRENFPRRNRIVAGISDATIVIESQIKGGSMITANLANDYNRDVFTFPGDVDRMYSKGCNHLIAEQKAHLIQDAAGFLKLMNWQKIVKKPVQSRLTFDLSMDEQNIYNVLLAEDLQHIDLISLKSGFKLSALSFLLMGMELNGVIKAFPGNRYSLC
jgi:DNA processing protein